MFVHVMFTAQSSVLSAGLVAGITASKAGVVMVMAVAEVEPIDAMAEITKSVEEGHMR